MNNKGFAITGILYTLFVFFMLLIIGSLASLSYKRTTLERTINGLNDDFLFVTGTEAANLKWVTEKNGKYFANFDGKYEFKLVKGNTITGKECYAYLNKGDEITPDSFEGTLIPSDCNTFLDSIKGSDINLRFGETNRINTINTSNTDISLNFNNYTLEKSKIMPVVVIEHDMILTQAYKFRGSE